MVALLKKKVVKYIFNNIEAEKSMLGKLILEATEYEDYIQALEIDDFSTKLNQDIFQTIKDLYKKSENIDIVSIGNMLKNQYLDIFSDLDNLSNNAIFKNTKTHFKIVKLEALKRYMSKELRNAFEEIKDCEKIEDVSELKNNMIQKISDFRVDINQLKDTKNEAILKVFEKIEKCINGDKGNLFEYLTGIRMLDYLCGGFNPPDLIILGARPAKGKTALALQIAYHIAMNNKNIVFITKEMEPYQLIQRLFSNISEVDNGKFKNGTFNNKDMEKYLAFMKEMNKRNIHFDNKVRTVQQIRSLLRKLKNVDMVVIDYLQLLISDKKTSVREQEVSSISRDLKQLCIDFQIPVLALSQLSRNNNNEPTCKDLRESGAIEQDADIVFFIHHKDETYGDVEWAEPKIIVAKDRNGKTGSFYLRFIPKFVKFKNLEV